MAQDYHGKHVLVVDDDTLLRGLVSKLLESMSLTVHEAASGKEFNHIFLPDKFSLVIMDRMLPDSDGLDHVKVIKAQGGNTGVLVLSGRSEPVDRVKGLDIGADDYLVKPFDNAELLARVRTILRRQQRSEKPTPTEDKWLGRWKICRKSKIVYSADAQTIPLTSGEFALLAYLYTHDGEVLSRDQIMRDLFSNDRPAFDRSIDVRVKRLRDKLKEAGVDSFGVSTVRNAGYLFTAIGIK